MSTIKTESTNLELSGLESNDNVTNNSNNDCISAEYIHNKQEYILLKEYFNLDYINQIFQAWFEDIELAEYLPQVDPNHRRHYNSDLRMDRYYHYNNHTYLGKVYIFDYIANQEIKSVLNITLTNNNILYQRQTLESENENENLSRYQQLDSSYLKYFHAIIKFATDYLYTRHLLIQIFYNYHLNILIFKAYNKKSDYYGIVITFQPGVNYDGLFDKENTYIDYIEK